MIETLLAVIAIILVFAFVEVTSSLRGIMLALEFIAQKQNGK